MCSDLARPEPKCPLMSHILCAVPSTNSHNYLKFEFNSEKYLKTRQLIKLAFNSPPPKSCPVSLALSDAVAVSVSASRFASKATNIFFMRLTFFMAQ